MRTKRDCVDCKNRFNRCALHRSRKDKRLLCHNCYISENKEIREYKRTLLPNVNNSSLKPKSPILEHSINENSYLMKGEDSVLAKKYDFDYFKRGTRECSELTRLRTGLAAIRNKRKSEGKFIAMEINKIKECSAEDNRKFLESFKKLK